MFSSSAARAAAAFCFVAAAAASSARRPCSDNAFSRCASCCLLFGLLSLSLERSLPFPSCDFSTKSLALELRLLLFSFHPLRGLREVSLRAATLRNGLGVRLGLLQPALASEVVLSDDLPGSFLHLADHLAQHTASRRLWRIGVCHAFSIRSRRAATGARRAE